MLDLGHGVDPGRQRLRERQPRSRSASSSRSDVSGIVTGIRFYKAPPNTGTHIGNLWTASGTKLAIGDLHGRDRLRLAAGRRSRPRCSINANTTYVASYFAPVGHTAQDERYLYPNPSPSPDAYSRVDSPPLHALRNTNGTVNGLFQNSSTSTFPTEQPERARTTGST